MGIMDLFFGKKGGGGGGKREPSKQLPSTVVAKEFGEVNVGKADGQWEVTFTILMEPTDAEGWQTGVAVDASGSMSGVFGKGLADGPKGPPAQTLFQEYIKKGWIQMITHQGQQIPILNEDCKVDLVRRGHFVWTKNEVEPVVRTLTAYLAANLDADGGTTVVYWACGEDGKGIELIGDLTAEDCASADIEGPVKHSFGGATCLTPAVKYFVDRFADAKNGIYLFITDGELNDLAEVKRYTIQLCKEIQAKKRNPIKCVLVGVGDSINEGQMEELDDLDSGTEIDVWDHKIAKDMRALVEIFAEVVSENQMVAPTGRLLDATGNVLKTFSDGVPAKIKFNMPVASNAFELEVAGQRIRQTVVA
jgi:hypothetical protein